MRFYKGKPMFMDLNGAFNPSMDRKEDEYVLWELTYELWNQL